MQQLLASKKANQELVNESLGRLRRIKCLTSDEIPSKLKRTRCLGVWNSWWVKVNLRLDKWKSRHVKED